MHSLKALILNLGFIILIASSLSACDQQSITITPEHLSIEELREDLKNELNQVLDQETNKEISALPLTISQSDGGLLLKGDPALIAKALIIAKRLDSPSSYYLEVRNTPINTISTTTETMQILLHPDQTISLGYITLTESPWKPLIKEHKSALQLHLDANLVLSIDIVNQQQQQASYYTGKHPMQLRKWIMAFNNSEINQGKKIITSRPKKQLWLRLIKANSQSGIRLR
jgi:hypothetical protein